VRGVAGSVIFANDFDRRRFVLYLEDVSEYWGGVWSADA
jgi:hypothetical protein